MCGRYRLKRPWRDLHALYSIQNDSNRIVPRWNIAPTQDVPVFRRGETGLDVSLLRWGLVPAWAKDLRIGNQCINARAESVAEKPAFRSAFRSRRCLLVADGHYEWRAEGKIKQPYLFTIGDDEPYTFAGLWEKWTAPTGETVETACLITTTPNAVAAEVHDRMPVILPRAAHTTWLDPKADAETLQGLLVPYAGEGMRTRKVTTRLNKATNEGPELDNDN